MEESHEKDGGLLPEPPFAKRHCGPHTFELKISDVSTLKSLLEICANLIKEMQFEVVSTPDFQGMSFKTIDTKQVCMVIARVECEVPICPENTMFRIRTQTLLSCLRSLPSDYVLQIYQERSSDCLRLASGPSFDEYEINFDMNTLMTSDDSDICDRIQQMEYNYTVNVDCGAMRTFIKLCKDLKAEDITMQIQRLSASGNPTAGQAPPPDSTMESLFVLKSTGDEVTAIERVFKSNAGECTVSHSRADAESGGTRFVECSEKYSVEYMSLFLRSMDRGDVTLQLSAQRPLLITYPLDSSKSMACFVLATKDE